MFYKESNLNYQIIVIKLFTISPYYYFNVCKVCSESPSFTADIYNFHFLSVFIIYSTINLSILFFKEATFGFVFLYYIFLFHWISPLCLFPSFYSYLFAHFFLIFQGANLDFWFDTFLFPNTSLKNYQYNFEHWLRCILYILCGIFALSFNQNIFFSHRKLWQTSIQTSGALLCSFSLLSTLPCTFQILISWSSYICLFMSMCHYSLWALPPFLVTGRCPQTKSQAIVGWSEAQLSVFFFPNIMVL